MVKGSWLSRALQRQPKKKAESAKPEKKPRALAHKPRQAGPAFAALVSQRRATPHFTGEPIPWEDLDRILELGRQAPSSNNLQPWRFLIVRTLEAKKRLREAANNQAKVEEASAVLIACADTEAWRDDTEEMLRLAQAHGIGVDIPARKERILSSMENRPNKVAWATKQTMIAFTTMMWAAEALGYDTAPMEGFDEIKVKEAFGIPKHVSVVALLGIGRLKGEDKPYGGRFPQSKTAFSESWGKPR